MLGGNISGKHVFWTLSRTFLEQSVAIGEHLHALPCNSSKGTVDEPWVGFL